MKKLFLYSLVLLLMAGCSNSGNGELTGVKRDGQFYQPDPFGMTYIPMGSFTMGGGDQDVPYARINQPRVITVSAFYMDETEITNNEYRQFVFWVRDSIARTLLGDLKPEEYLIEENKETGELYDPPILNWETKIDWSGEEERDILEEMYYPMHERFFRKKEIDTRKLFYEYYWIDLKAAARKEYSDPDANSKDAAFANRRQGRTDRSVYIRKETINVYPDTLTWIHDYSYSYNEPMTKRYFWHPAYDNYPVVGVSWKQAKAFSIWRTEYLNSFLSKNKDVIVNEFRLPTESEWEWAARGGYELNPYPWGGPYTRNENGCFLANFKPNRGDYTGDGGVHTVIVGHYPPNDFGLYDMAGNVSEWTEDAYDESTYNFAWDLNMSYSYNAREDDPIALKRKVIRGGSWKDVHYYLEVASRAYEYQDTAKSYIGFRCVQNYLGRQKGDNPSRASKVYK
ncbi:MAG: SUMF1/EgtB/PvdO family nonheme iron enzyme [Bacteroidales bacterium]|jgi:gliding motility-associated lipoprotein GldK|nr:SUMF1/EgtB/PvdO family nonheme iron enzyme [Bacteroidales bacterium]MDD2322482.1 SUMF1/EgtB/PvdO family nonheme iron enzyme [Bacteroidales bacterium]MDD3010976.1 SUMF1/EgtB/PvdO family nonheme iron enzyme [Bacteroidales bacterium]MDD3961114.1 SUMF1/EgtB/PvdO family nonheme iron enzyme [Bacteroidales bacterium]MDY0284929.1 SUMF1/EgtB/PvdO family nonheme iron enzyme [Bacteroidales bacterium]